MATVRFALVGVCYISEEHARLSGTPHHRDTLGKERVLVSCACVHRANHKQSFRLLEQCRMIFIYNYFEKGA